MDIRDFDGEVPRKVNRNRPPRQETVDLLAALDAATETGVNKQILCNTEEEAKKKVAKIRSLAARYKRAVSAGYIEDPNGGYTVVFGARRQLGSAEDAGDSTAETSEEAPTERKSRRSRKNGE